MSFARSPSGNMGPQPNSRVRGLRVPAQGLAKRAPRPQNEGCPRAGFPGYLFVALDLRRDRWRSINGTFGVMSLIMAEERPVPVPRGVVEAIIDYVDEFGICRFDRDLMEGQAIRVTSGPLAEAVGELVRLDKSGRVRVLLEIMGGRVLATIERSSLVAA